MVSFGSDSDVAARNREVRFTPKSRHRQATPACPFGAISGSRGILRMRHAIDHQLLDKRKPDPERRAAVNLISCRYEPMVRFNNGARDGQPHAHAFRLAGEKRFEDLF
jgi:hypothetical protein